MSYINKEVLAEMIEAKADTLIEGKEAFLYTRKWLDLLPTADVVEVVRCKECKNRNTPECAMWYRCSVCDGQWSWETDNDYCSYGERSENGK